MSLRLNSTAAQRFEIKIDRSGDCHLWTARRDSDGYGRFRPDGANTSEVPAHRVAFVLGGGTIPDGMQVLHTCDNPPCVRYDHLFIGTNADNMADRNRKGRARAGTHKRARGLRNGRHTHPERTARGEDNGWARWTPSEVRAIRAAFAAGESQGSIARRLGASQSGISAIVRRVTWAHIA
jgi:hypothetical protein